MNFQAPQMVEILKAERRQTCCPQWDVGSVTANSRNHYIENKILVPHCGPKVPCAPCLPPFPFSSILPHHVLCVHWVPSFRDRSRPLLHLPTSLSSLCDPFLAVLQGCFVQPTLVVLSHRIFALSFGLSPARLYSLSTRTIAPSVLKNSRTRTQEKICEEDIFVQILALPYVYFLTWLCFSFYRHSNVPSSRLCFKLSI